MPDLREQLQSGLADRYRLERELGRGGMATVFLAHDLRHDRRVALNSAQRLGRLEEYVGGRSDPVTYILVIDDHQEPVDQDELAAYVERLCPEGGYTLMMLPDNGRDPRGAQISYGGRGWCRQGPLIRNGHPVPDGQSTP